jgi:hypothetical protein
LSILPSNDKNQPIKYLKDLLIDIVDLNRPFPEAEEKQGAENLNLHLRPILQDFADEIIEDIIL